MEAKLKMNDVVVLAEDLPAKHFETGHPLILRRGQMGTVVMPHQGGSFEVEFAGGDGKAYAILPIMADKLIGVKNAPEPVGA